MENGGKENQFIASQTSTISVSGGKGWQFYASVFSKTKNLDAKTKNQRKNCIPKHREQGFWWQVFRFRGETYRRTLHKSKPASISGNNHGLGCTKETVSMSVCIRIEGFDGIWWQGKTMFCIPNKQNPCFRWQSLAVLCIRFFQNKDSGCKDQESKEKPASQKRETWISEATT